MISLFILIQKFMLPVYHFYFVYAFYVVIFYLSCTEFKILYFIVLD